MNRSIVKRLLWSLAGGALAAQAWAGPSGEAEVAMAAQTPAEVPAAASATVPGTASTTMPTAALFTSPIGSGDQPPPPWRLALLPRQTKPVTAFGVVDFEGQRVLRIAALHSYGKLLHPVDEAGAGLRHLRWSWRVDQAPEGADLRHRAGDDVALRVCAFFDWPMERLSLLERTRMLAAEVLAGSALPTAVLCYTWDAGLPVSTVMPNAFTRRVRMMIVDGDTRVWREHLRDLHKDFRTAFADEWQEGDAVPPLRALAIGADTDNTGSESLAFVRAIALEP